MKTEPERPATLRDIELMRDILYCYLASIDLRVEALEKVLIRRGYTTRDELIDEVKQQIQSAFERQIKEYDLLFSDYAHKMDEIRNRRTLGL